MKSYKINKKEAEQKKKSKKENAQDIISKSIKKMIKSYKINNSEVSKKLKNQKNKYTSDIISKSLLKPARIPARHFSGGVQVGNY